MTELFKKAAFFTDIHFGLYNNSEVHNQDCLEFVQWFCEQVRINGCDIVFVLGDTYHNPAHIGLLSLHYAQEAFDLLAALDIPIIVLVGNHDMFYKKNRSVHSVSMFKNWPNITLINEVTLIDDVLLCPYLVGGEYSTVADTKAKYVFGHFELPMFLMNDMIESKDRGGLLADHFYQCEMVFSGHFHKRQMKHNAHGIPIWYIGNAFPHDMNDLGDRDRGMMILEWGGTPEFVNWPDAPNYSRVTLSGLVGAIENDEFDSYFTKKSIIECIDDVGVDTDTQNELRTSLAGKIRKMQFLPFADSTDVSDTQGIQVQGKTIPQAIEDNLMKYDTRDSNIDPELLITLFKKGPQVDVEISNS